MKKNGNDKARLSIDGQKWNGFLIQVQALVRHKAQSIQDVSGLKNFHNTDSKSKEKQSKAGRKKN